jgi:flagellar hook assembly protein FlgD
MKAPIFDPATEGRPMSRPSVPAVTHPWFGRTARVSDARKPRLHPAITQLRFALPRTQHVRIHVQDASGRLVRTLHEGTLEAGEHVSCWDGRDDRGAALNPGSYMMRLEVDAAPLTSRVVTLN